MRKRITLLLIAVLVLGGAWFAYAENGFKSLSVTATSQTYTFPRNAVSAVKLCSYGANIAYYRIFSGSDTVGASTTSYAPLPAGTATAPICVSYTRTDTVSGYYKAVSAVCTTAETATVTVEFQ